MATSVILKRSSRLRSRDHSIKVSSETKCKPRKIITVDENTQKINVSARRLRPRQNKKNYCDDSKLLQRYVPTKQHDSLVILEKLDLNNKKVPVYKTLKSEKSLEEKNDIYDFKFDPNDIREKPKKKKGKPKKKNVNKLGSRMTKNKTKFKKKIELSKLEIQMIKESESEKREDIYLNKIEAPRINTDICTIKKSKKDMNQIETPEINTNIQAIEEIVSKENIEAIKTSRIKIDVPKVKESIKKIIIDEGETSQTDSIIHDIGEITLPEETFMNQNRKRDTKKPKILSIENADNIVVAKTFSNVKDTVFRPFRPKNIFDNKISDRQPKNTLNSSLLMKSFSPITKISNNLDFGSPWRPPTFPMFSQAKHFAQSTPNVSIEVNNENLENIQEQDKENLKMNKKNKQRKNKEKRQKKFYKKEVILEQVLTNENVDKIQPMLANKAVEQSAPSRISLGKIRTLLEKPDNNEDNKQVMNEVQTKVVKSFETQKEKHLVDYLNFSDTFDVMSETERLSNVDTNVPLFFDLEPSYFSKVFIIKIL